MSLYAKMYESTFFPQCSLCHFNACARYHLAVLTVQQKISALLRLPSSFRVATAAVARLRITVPADLYKSSIEIDISGVRAFVDFGEDGKSRKPPHSNRTSLTPRSGFGDEVLPTPQDLAKSFLEQEPPDEKALLEAELGSCSTSMQRSVVSSSDTDSETPGYGATAGFALPAFLASFLAGVTERLILVIRDISIEVNLRLDYPVKTSPTDRSHQASAAVSLVLDVAQLDLDKVSDDRAGNKPEIPGSEQQSLRGHVGPSGRRRIVLKGIEIALKSSPDVLATWISIASGEDASKFQASPTHSWPRQYQRNESVSGNSANRQEASNTLDEHQATTQDRLIVPPVPTNELDTSLQFSTNSSGAGSYTDATDDQDWPADSQESLAQSQTLEDSLRSIRDSVPHPTQLARPRESHSPSAAASDTRGLDLHRESGYTTPTGSSGLIGQENHSNADISAPRFPSVEDLTESHVFSHAEAESIYMSVINDGSEDDEAFPSMPGEWQNHATYNDDSEDPSLSRGNSKPVMPGEPTHFHSDIALPRGETLSQALPRNASFGDPIHTKSPPRTPVLQEQHRTVYKRLVTVDETQLLLANDTQRKGTERSKEFNAPMRSEFHTETLGNSLDSMHKLDMPGNFSYYADSSASAQRTISSQKHHASGSKCDRSRSDAPNVRNVPTIDLIVGNILGRLDITACSMLLQIVSKVWEALEDPQPLANSASRPSGHHGTSFENRIRVQALLIDIALHENCQEIDPVSTSSSVPKPRSLKLNEIPGSNVRVLGHNTYVSLTRTAELLSCNLDLDKLALKLGEQDLLSFSREHALRNSSHSHERSANKDVSLSYRCTESVPELTLSSLPVKISVDLHKIDEMLNSFGGLSALLEAGNSMLSDTKLSTPAGKDKAAGGPQRTVRFDSMTKGPTASHEGSVIKTNIRVGGSAIEVKSKICDLRFHSSAIKVVSRDNLIGFQIDDMKCVGPFGSGFNERRSASLSVHNLALKYLYRPEEQDLTRLISLLTPSKDKFAEEDDILVDTLVRQRKRGAVARLSIASISAHLLDLEVMDTFEQLGKELSKLSTITKYLPQDSRPGLLTLGSIQRMDLSVDHAPRLGKLSCGLTASQLAHVGSPSLLAIGIGKLSVTRGSNQDIIHPVTASGISCHPLMLMARIVGDELDPTVKIKLFNACLEYDVKLVMDVLGITEATGDADPISNLANSTSNIAPGSTSKNSCGASSNITLKASDPFATKVDLQLRDCAIGLTPRAMPSKAMFLLTTARLTSSMPMTRGLPFRFVLSKGALCLTNDATALLPIDDHEVHEAKNEMKSDADQQTGELCRRGYVSVGWISAVELVIRHVGSLDGSPARLDIALDEGLLVMETCADSTQTLIDLFGSLQPPMPPSNNHKYRTEVAPVQDLMASFTGDAFSAAPDPPGPEIEDSDILDEDLHAAFGQMETGSDETDDFDTGSLGNSLFVSSPLEISKQMGDLESELSVHTSNETNAQESPTSGLKPRIAPRQAQAAASKWDSTRNQYIPLTASEALQASSTLTMKNMHLIWNLHDGYDWESTRTGISKAVREVEEKSEEKRNRRRAAIVDDDEDESVIGDFLFNSIYIGIPVNQEPRSLSRHINGELHDDISETASRASTATKRLSHQTFRPQRQRLRLERSKRHKLTFELRGVSVKTYTFPAGGETASSTDVRIVDLEIFDHVPTSTWKKFATYMVDAGPREDGKPMVHLEICDVKPVPELAASELVIRVRLFSLGCKIS